MGTAPSGSGSISTSASVSSVTTPTPVEGGLAMVIRNPVTDLTGGSPPSCATCPTTCGVRAGEQHQRGQTRHHQADRRQATSAGPCAAWRARPERAMVEVRRAVDLRPPPRALRPPYVIDTSGAGMPYKHDRNTDARVHTGAMRESVGVRWSATTTTESPCSSDSSTPPTTRPSRGGHIQAASHAGPRQRPRHG